MLLCVCGEEEEEECESLRKAEGGGIFLNVQHLKQRQVASTGLVPGFWSIRHPTNPTAATVQQTCRTLEWKVRQSGQRISQKDCTGLNRVIRVNHQNHLYRNFECRYSIGSRCFVRVKRLG